MDWNDLKFALAVARHGSLSAAARALGTTQPTVSRRLAGLERKTGVKLFERRKDGLTPTQLGAALTEGLDLMDEGCAGGRAPHCLARHSSSGAKA